MEPIQGLSFFLMLLFNFLQFIQGAMDCGTNYHLYDDLPSDMIIGGMNARTGAWPSMAVIKYRGYFLCGAAVVKVPGQPARWLLTAAHCLGAIRKKDKAKIVVGITEKSDLGYAYAIEKLIPHPEFVRTRNCRNPGSGFDIALIKVTEDISMKSGKVEWACMPRAKELKILEDKRQIEGLMCHAIGFGIHREGSRKNSEVLQQIRVDKFNDCIDLYPACYTEKQLCWGDRGAQSCVGDSGAPLLCLLNGRWTIAGVSSKVMGRRCDEGSLYVNVGDMSDWITDTVKKN